MLNSYAWTYSDSGECLVASGESSLTTSHQPLATAWLPSGGLMPVTDTSGVTDALLSGGYAALDSLLLSCTSSDGTATYSYDPAGQLIGTTYSGDQTDESYSYDSNGNRITANGATYSTGPDNRLLSDGTYTYQYDAEGNRTERFIDANQDRVLDTGDIDITEYHWDNRNRLTEVLNRDSYGGAATKVVDYIYDVENRLIGENVDSNGDGVVDHQTRFAYDGNQIVLQFDKDGTGDVTNSDLSHRYLWRANAVDQLLANEQVTNPQTPGNVVWPLTDNLGTVRDLAVYNAATGETSVVNHRTFDSFGNLKSSINPSTGQAAAVDCLFGFTGRAFDKNMNSQYNTTRWYDPRVGRWDSEDWIGLLGRDTNLSRYCGNDPINKTDPNGEVVPIVVGAIVVGVWWFFTPNVANAPGPGDQTYPDNSFPNPVPALVAGATVATGLEAVGAVAGSGRAALLRISFGHGARHLVGTALSAAEVEAAITQQIAITGATGAFWGWVQVNGQWIQYRVFVLANGVINVGTYFPVPGPFKNR